MSEIDKEVEELTISDLYGIKKYDEITLNEIFDLGIVEDISTQDIYGVADIEYRKRKLKKRVIAVNILIVILILSVIVSVCGGIFVNKKLDNLNYDEDAFEEVTTQIIQDDDEVLIEETTVKEKEGTTKYNFHTYASYKPVKKRKLSYTVNKNVAEKITLPKEMKEDEEKTRENYYSNAEISSDSNVTNILLCGIDNGTEGKSYHRSDAMMVLSINRNDSSVRVASLSRAVYVTIDGFGQSRLNAAYECGGIKCLINTIENNYKIHLDSYISTDFKEFQKIIDILGGVEIFLSKDEAETVADMTKGYRTRFFDKGEGTYNLDGISALMYTRLRKIDSDRARTGRQRKVLRAIIEKCATMSTFQLIEIMDEVFPYVTTSMSKSEVLSYAMNVKEYMTWAIKETVIPNMQKEMVTINGLEVIIVDWDQTVKYSRKFFYS